MSLKVVSCREFAILLGFSLPSENHCNTCLGLRHSKVHTNAVPTESVQNYSTFINSGEEWREEGWGRAGQGRAGQHRIEKRREEKRREEKGKRRVEETRAEKSRADDITEFLSRLPRSIGEWQKGKWRSVLRILQREPKRVKFLTNKKDINSA